MELIALTISIAAIGTIFILQQRSERRIQTLQARQADLNQTSLDRDAKYQALARELKTALDHIEALQDARTKIHKDIETVIQRIRTLERDRTEQRRALGDLEQRLSPLEDARTKIHKDIETVIQRIRTVEANQTDLSQHLQSQESDMKKALDRVRMLENRNLPTMPKNPRPELDLSDAIEELDKATLEH